MARCGCSGQCSCKITAGSNVTVSGTGTTSDPFVVSSTGGGGGGSGTVESVLAGDGIAVDSSDAANPSISLAQDSATDGQVMTWSDADGKWEPEDLAWDDITGKPAVIGAGADAAAARAAIGAGTASTKADVGLGSVDNTADSAKPVSTAQQAALNLKVATSSVGAASGVASLDASTHLPVAQIAAGATITVLSTTSWPARPTSRTDVFVRWVDAGGLGTTPAGGLDGDTLVAAS